MKKMAYK